ncbi:MULTISPECIES: DUF6055 domain-containing protein [Mucilaginibacter]|uniref:DUF6055 domain-containing protein n=1 Tax=Mucilaginibacter TaxID=423349 RepID=UPI00373FD225
MKSSSFGNHCNTPVSGNCRRYRLKDGTRVYGSVNSSSTGTTSFVVPANTTYLWLIVTGAPTQHWKHLNDGNASNDEEWPYQVKLTGTSLDDAVIK